MTDDMHTISPEDETSNIRVSLIPSSHTDDSLIVPSDPMAIPSTTRTQGLSLIVNHLLNADKNDNASNIPDTPFQFLLNGRFLRTSIETAARREGLSLEHPLEIQYLQAQVVPRLTCQTKCEDWITALSYSHLKGILCTGAYDGNIRVFTRGLKEEVVVKGHNGSIQCMDCVEFGGKLMIASGSMDQTLVTHLYDNDLSIHRVYEKGHTASISSMELSVENGNVRIASGDWNGGLCLWKTDVYVDTNKEPEEKKRKSSTSLTTTPFINKTTPIWNIRAHSDNISSLLFGTHHPTLITSSWDHSIKSWDINTQNVLLTLNGSKVITCLTKCINSDVVASGHPDCTVRLWDMRTNNKDGTGLINDTMLRPSHTAWITSVQWSPVNSYVLSSASHDGSIKLWDIRSSVPLYTIPAQEKDGKVLCLAHGKDEIYSGGSDCIVRCFAY